MTTAMTHRQRAIGFALRIGTSRGRRRAGRTVSGRPRRRRPRPEP
ncbi:hypothetical protein ACIOHO_33800 [Streptomyces sp. NPDC087849]